MYGKNHAWKTKQYGNIIQKEWKQEGNSNLFYTLRGCLIPLTEGGQGYHSGRSFQGYTWTDQNVSPPTERKDRKCVKTLPLLKVRLGAVIT